MLLGQKEAAMKEKAIFANPFRMLSPKLNREAVTLEKLYEKQVSESVDLEEGLLITISKLIEIVQLLEKAFATGNKTQMDRCEALAAEVHRQEQILTGGIIASGAKGPILKGVLRFPYRMERIGDMMESILNCCRLKAQRGIPFSDKAHWELEQIFTNMREMMVNLRDTFMTPNRVLLEAIVSQGKKVGEMIEEFKIAHWERLEAGFCHIAASSLYRDILDSCKTTNEYLAKMSETLLELGTTDQM